MTVTINGDLAGFADLGENVITLPSTNPSGGRQLVKTGSKGIILQKLTLSQPGTLGSDSSLSVTANAVGVIQSLSNTADISLEGPIYDLDSIARWE